MKVGSESRGPGGGPLRTTDGAYAIISMVPACLILWQLFLGSICKACKFYVVALEVGYMEEIKRIRNIWIVAWWGHWNFLQSQGAGVEVPSSPNGIRIKRSGRIYWKVVGMIMICDYRRHLLGPESWVFAWTFGSFSPIWYWGRGPSL